MGLENRRPDRLTDRMTCLPLGIALRLRRGASRNASTGTAAEPELLRPFRMPIPLGRLSTQR